MSASPTLSARLTQFDHQRSRAADQIFISHRSSSQSTPRPGAEGQLLSNMLLAVKDNIDVEGFDTTAACPAFAYRPAASAAVVQRLAAAGATVVGKTNLDQFACGLVGTRSPYGEVPNAIHPDFVSGGSSSGSAVAVAAGLVDIALGTDTAGSGRVPAAFNNIVGIKPSRGLLSLSGSVPACRHLDCISIFARSVPLAVKTLKAAAGYDASDPFSQARELDAHFMGDAPRLAMPNPDCLEFFGDKLSADAFARSLELARASGAQLVPVDMSPMIEAARALYEDAWVAERYNAIASFFDQHQDEMDPVVRAIIGSGKRFTASDLFSAMVRLGQQRQKSAAIFEDCDALLVPTAPTFPSRAAVRAEPFERNRELGYYTNFVNLFDLAAIAVPTTFRSDDLPFGVTLIGAAGSDLRLADFAQRLHENSGLHLGADRHAEQESMPISWNARSNTVKVVAVGAHMQGLPLNGQLRERGARLLAATRTAPLYRLFKLADCVPPKPGLVRVASGEPGSAIAVEVWEMPLAEFGSFVAAIPHPLGIGVIELADGSQVQGFVCEASALKDENDITGFGGWRAFLDHAKTQTSPTISDPK
jgi:allophanate hydrolase